VPNKEIDSMKQFVVTITSRGRVTVPAPMRRHLGLKANDKLIFVLDADGSVRLRVFGQSTVASVSGAAGKLPMSLSWHEMRDIAREDALKEHGLEG
jgi:AbrB family looped-hinge helix DNA binding protein